MKLSDMLANQPPPLSIPGARSEIRKRQDASRKRLVVVDDDPTGTQTVDGVRVYMDWSEDLFRRALSANEPVFYVSTNSRALSADEVKTLGRELGRNLSAAALETNAKPLIASRSDSTLRGHFPHEVEALASGFGLDYDGVIIVPAFFEGGRFTIDDTHWVLQGEEMVSAELTEFARDPVFGFRNANLKLWVEEKTSGAVSAASVRSISLDTIRTGGPEAVANELMQTRNRQPVIVNAACYEDLEVFVIGLILAESRGKSFIYRCAASFVKVRGGFENKPLLTSEEMQPGAGPGLVVVGSYVDRTSRQLEALLQSGLATGVELHVDPLLDPQTQAAEIERVVETAAERMARGQSVAVYTSRARRSVGQDKFLQMGQVIMSGLCEVVRRIPEKPGFLVAKGGITSIEIARSGLGLKEGLVLGQILPGVPVWKLGGEALWSGIPYVVFPGNVGNEEALVDAVKTLRGGN
ncbi:MAG: four-carbon acid sugar kinase family protein [Armatimonadota bacterium]|nr:four-carbon acid sugar kinase family protein [Armatimonadota bacterium]